MSILSYIFNNTKKASLLGDDMRKKTSNSLIGRAAVRNSLRRGSKTDNNQKMNAYIRVGRQGSVHIPSSEIAELPEVKEMQRMAMRIVTGK
ncbi:TPA: hypothetical protein ACHWKL_001347 [Providencia stuartii]|uniref:hypothetical protein n=1 Tax=Providencia stuartii TaxID=588 RepID=UPI000D8F7E5A|nr:hypothetical protein [Providencia stuartii]TPW78674.1 hypothetical protein DL505_10625 [Providencia stuartii]SPY60690.1 Uncharacterised protein [Providencia stuartii]HAT8010171.1 hypothetical protein [Providencia stuartii]HEM6867908.1 hypothetical protein [Providencia stuartii]HEM7171497.1 hypothetical protein [Providencia stuartii]